MNILQYNKAIEEELSKVDPETGEALFDVEAFEQLQVEREAKIDGLFAYIVNQQHFVEACKAEEASIADRRQKAERHIERLKEYAMLVLGDEKKRVSPIYQATISKSEKVVPEEGFIKWAKRNAKHLLRYKTAEQIKAYKEPEVDKVAVKAALKKGEQVKFAGIQTNYSLKVK